MFDHKVGLSVPSKIERIGSRYHGLVHVRVDSSGFYTQDDIEIVTESGKVLAWPYEVSGTVGYKLNALSFLYKHPLAETHPEEEDGTDKSGYVVFGGPSELSELNHNSCGVYPVSAYTPDNMGQGLLFGTDIRFYPPVLVGENTGNSIHIESPAFKYDKTVCISADGRKRLAIRYPMSLSDLMNISTSNPGGAITPTGYIYEITGNCDRDGTNNLSFRDLEEIETNYTGEDEQLGLTWGYPVKDVEWSGASYESMYAPPICHLVDESELTRPQTGQPVYDDTKRSRWAAYRHWRTRKKGVVDMWGLEEVALLHLEYVRERRDKNKHETSREYSRTYSVVDVCTDNFGSEGLYGNLREHITYTVSERGYIDKESLTLSGWGGSSEVMVDQRFLTTETNDRRIGTKYEGIYLDTNREIDNEVSVFFEGSKVFSFAPTRGLAGYVSRSAIGFPDALIRNAQTYGDFAVALTDHPIDDPSVVVDGSNIAAYRVGILSVGGISALYCYTVTGVYTSSGWTSVDWSNGSRKLIIGKVFGYGKTTDGFILEGDEVDQLKRYIAFNHLSGEFSGWYDHPVFYI